MTKVSYIWWNKRTGMTLQTENCMYAFSYAFSWQSVLQVLRLNMSLQVLM